MKLIGSLVLCSLMTAACVAPAPSEASAAPEADTLTAAPEEAALATWLEGVCPDGVAVERVDTRTGERKVVACEEVRATLMANEEARAVLRELYEASLRPSSDGEPVTEAQQRWSPVGFVCSALMTSAALAFNWPGGKQGCNDPHAKDPDACAKVTTFGFGGLGLLCAFI